MITCVLPRLDWLERTLYSVLGRQDFDLTSDLNAIEEADIPNVTVATLGNTEKITLIQVPVQLIVILI
jgi:hypothetical protein